MRLTSIFLVVITLTGCKSLVKEPVVFPEALAQECPEPTTKIETNKDLANHTLALRQALRACNADKEAIRGWIEDTKK